MSEVALQPVEESSARTVRLGLTLLALVAAVALIGGTAATISTSTVNPGGTFTAAGPELSAEVAGSAPCVARGNTVNCGDLFRHRLAPGGDRSSTVTLRNTGNIPIDGLQLWSSGCRQGAGSGPFSGTSDLCVATLLTIHDDLHDLCYFPRAAAGACRFEAGSTLKEFAVRNGPSSPISLPPPALLIASPFTFAVQLDPNAGNDYQGRWAELSITWRATQG